MDHLDIHFLVVMGHVELWMVVVILLVYVGLAVLVLWALYRFALRPIAKAVRGIRKQRD